MTNLQSRTKAILNMDLTGQESEVSEQTSIITSGNVSENASKNNIDKVSFHL